MNKYRHVVDQVISHGFNLLGTSVFGKITYLYTWNNSAQYATFTELDQLSDEEVSEIIKDLIRNEYAKLGKNVRVNFRRIYDDGWGKYNPPNIYYDWCVEYPPTELEIKTDNNKRIESEISKKRQIIDVLQREINVLESGKM